MATTNSQDTRRHNTRSRPGTEQIQPAGTNGRGNEPTDRPSHSNLLQPDRVRVATVIYERPGTKILRLMYPPDPDKQDVQEEVVLRLQGYVVQCQLPPILSSTQYVPSTVL